MNVFKVFWLIGALFLATSLLCWILTSHWIFGPIVTIAAFMGGVSLISLLGVSMLHEEE